VQHPVIHFSIRLTASKQASKLPSQKKKNKKNNGKDQYYYYCCCSNASE
jgi:hypothetical protein